MARAACAQVNRHYGVLLEKMVRISFAFFLASLLRGRILLRLMGGIICIALVGACDQHPVVPRLAEGYPFPALNLPHSNDNILSASAFQGKFIVLNIWATWCPPCRREMPSLERLHQKLDPRRFAVIGMSTDADERLAAEFLLQNGINFSNFFDSDGKFAKQWELKVYPETFLIAPDGKLVERIVGLREWDSPEIIAQLEAMYQSHARKPIISK